ncbi:GTP cyclohydrolase I FolE [Trichococcus ilyis]|jgi:GTP cyclohydrolase I|uniref:GTP cyclohydrolase 1 n=1 Tax=Trichococcus ilyis TaxID=640938 RepID=A0A143YAG4_9LACT|nr:GTP cyclohydrolase I FolE [Trichococcus ilyis]CZQ85941.1 gtp cyclohydrolase i signature 2 [Trichococcus ilyis]SEJ69748.1 GTP cyclohydrolase I [Trichococcus ilyis]
MDLEKIESAVQMILEAIGEDPNRSGIKDTPKRVARMYAEIFSGIEKDPTRHAKVVFHEETDEIVLVKDIPFYSTCEHHLVPFFGVGHIAYMPKDGQVIGLSKLARILDDVSKRPQIQERITTTVADILMEFLEPQGVMVVLEAEHMCMTMRGVKKPGSKTVTSAVRGAFENSSKSRSEVLELIKL